MIKAIIFDIGGVLVDLDKEKCVKSFKEDCGLESIADFLDTCHQGGPIRELEEGSIDEAGFYRKMRALSRPGTTDRDIEESFCSLLAGVPEAKAGLLRRLKESYDLYLLSNNNGITMRRTAELMALAGIPLETTFKGVYVSSEMKLFKPGREIFDEAVRRSGHRKEETLFIDDSPVNVRGARDAGLHAAHYTLGTSLEDTLERALAQISEFSLDLHK